MMGGITFTIKEAPVLAEHRPLYKIAQLLLILFVASRGSKSSLARLQLFNWALKTPDRNRLLEGAAATGRLETTGWGFDPAVPIALRFAVSDGLIEDVSTGYVCTHTGEQFVRAVIGAGLLPVEREVLQQVGKKVTEGMINEVASRWEN
jgi:hypothetical protein